MKSIYEWNFWIWFSRVNDYALIVVHLHLIIVHIIKRGLGNEIFKIQSILILVKRWYVWRHRVIMMASFKIQRYKILSIYYFCWHVNGTFFNSVCTWKSETIRLWLSRTQCWVSKWLQHKLHRTNSKDKPWQVLDLRNSERPHCSIPWKTNLCLS